MKTLILSTFLLVSGFAAAADATTAAPVAPVVSATTTEYAILGSHETPTPYETLIGLLALIVL